ncbi:DUF551 domain-containing protein [Acinetobacter sp. HY1485]|uniref:DUF551 domain-containing protein n=1 Tax=Acinetobacter sp. HY1485 TaxID=2970918 RepID=UPI0022B95E98|nr:DUF551 domain-containing protein [Acinetobacter sp. HY1485]
MLNRDQIAHEYMLEIIKADRPISMDGIEKIAENCFVLADAMIAEAQKRKNTERPAVIGDDWISVEEQLPEDGQQVLIYSKETHIASAAYRKAMPEIGCDKDDWSGWFSDEVDEPNVTHWQPLPNLPIQSGNNV